MKRWIWLLLLVACSSPGWPEGAELTPGRVTGTSIELTWPAANGTVDIYEVKRGDQVLAAALAGNTTRFVAGGLDDGIAYSFSVRARASGSDSWSSPLRLEITTPDVTPPAWREKVLSVTVEAETEHDARLKLTWGELEDNVGVERILVHHGRGEPIVIAGGERSHVVESGAPDGIWQVTAEDAAGNASEELAYRVETELTPVRRENLKGRAIGVLSERDATETNLFGPRGLGVDVETPAGRGPTPVWIGDNGRQEARAYATSRLGAMTRCYEQARAEDAALGGALTVTLVVGADGEVNPSRMDGLKNASLRGCLRSVLAKGRLPVKAAAGFRADVTIHMNPNPTKSE